MAVDTILHESGKVQEMPGDQDARQNAAMKEHERQEQQPAPVQQSAPGGGPEQGFQRNRLAGGAVG
jgi:hypothetical protein